MTTENTAGRKAPGLRALVYDAIPPNASPTDTLTHPLSRYVLERAEGDIIELTRQKISDQLGDVPHVVLTLRDGDLDLATDGELTGLLRETDGGVIVFGVTYSLDDTKIAIEDDCPECSARGGVEISRSDTPGPDGRIPILVECPECGTVWDSWARQA